MSEKVRKFCPECGSEIPLYRARCSNCENNGLYRRKIVFPKKIAIGILLLLILLVLIFRF